jgi:hypothetical protein
VTVYVPAVVTEMEEVVSPVLHNRGPVKPEAVNTELPQLFATDTVGADGVDFGAVAALATALVQPFTV